LAAHQSTIQITSTTWEQ